MSTSRAAQILYDAESRLNGRFARVVSLLTAPARVRSLLVQNQARPSGDGFKRLWTVATLEAANHHFKRRDTDYVFENFWGNPGERNHSKLLGFLLDPQEHHGCGHFLLEIFLSLLEKAAKASSHRNSIAAPRFLAEGCIVRAESGGYIDLRIERERDDGRFAIIIENKIKGAPDQYGYRASVRREASQLETYVERMCRRGFDYDKIHVFYLPLEGDRDAKQEDVDTITKRKTTYTRITFKDDIRLWLKQALKDWPTDPTKDDLREHLSYYARLLDYLVNKNKLNEMDTKTIEILKSIQTDEEQAGLLSLSDIDAACEAAASLRRVFVRVLRGRLLRRIHEEFRKERLDANFYVIDWPRITRVEPESDYSDEFEKTIVVGVQVTDAIAVGLAWEPDQFFFAYFKLPDKERRVDGVVLQEAKRLHAEFRDQNQGDPREPYYAFKYEEVTPEQCEKPETAVQLAKQIREMRESLQHALRLP